MTGYHGRRGPNVSQYVANLNTVPAAQEYGLQEPLNLEDDLALFTNNEFIDWDVAGDFDVNAAHLDFSGLPQSNQKQHTQDHLAQKDNTIQQEQQHPAASKGLDFVASDFQFTDFAGFQNPVMNTPMHGQPHAYPVPPTYTSPVSQSVSPITPHFDISAGTKRKVENLDHGNHHLGDEGARIAAEEDKRRRNTAASARFRIKKKQREQALEKTAKEMTDRVHVLESRIQQLEMENSWLKSLITEKNQKSSSDISAMFKKFTEEKEGERSTGARTDGVGTEGKETKVDA